ncbi:MAG TPA: tRNA lysidine(34) synthetase TilS [Candidatus Omnitrophota bacterium]|nr:tRNA lysidine(34) synthetase TilS [Candidatus Omnitrophota bacterium]
MKFLKSKPDPAFDQKSLVYRFQRHALSKGVLKPKGSYLIGCSGGADSVALFHLVRMAFPETHLALAHFNHGLRARTAKRDELFVKKLAAQYQVPFFAGRAEKKNQNKLSIEEWARAQRYRFLRTVYQKTKQNALLLAHHADDQAETVLMRMCQGTGPRGLEAIREVFVFEKMKCVRPLLPFLKTEISHFLKEHRFAFCEDETNRSPKFLRNRIRLQVLPYLQKQINPQVARALARIPEIVRDENELIEALAVQVEKKALIQSGKRMIRLRALVFREAHFALQFRVLDRLIKRLDPSAGVLFEHAALIKSSLGKSAFVMDLPRGIKLVGNKNTITVECSRAKNAR